MVSSSSTSKPPSRYEVRSISLPTRSHPTTLVIEEELNRLKSWEASSSSSSSSASASVSIGLSGLVELYRRVDDLLNLPLTQQALSQHQHEKWVNELVDGSMRFLDICESTRDTVSSIKENLREVQSSLRRRKAGDSAEVKAYISFLRRTKKETEKSLKHMEKKAESSAPHLDLDQHLSAVVRVLQEAGSVTGAVFGSLLSFLLVPGPAKKRCSRWGAVARLVHKGAVSCEGEGESFNELEAVEIALTNFKNGEGVNKKLEALDVAMEELEDGLESLFRRLIHTRVSFLNILSQ